MQPLLITQGDPAGIGPEVLAQYLATASLGASSTAATATSTTVILGSAEGLYAGARAAGVDLDGIGTMPPDASPDELPAGLWLRDLGPLPEDFEHGKVQAGCGALAVAAVELAANWCLAGQAGAMVTCPLNKEAIHAAGFVNDIGHQEILARIAGVASTATLLMTPGLRVVHLSTHKSLAQAVAFISRASVLEKLQLTQRTFQAWGMSAPRIAVAGVNPHNREGGLLGQEEIEAIAPAVLAARDEGIDATGPIPADSVFNRAINGEFDAVLAMYHDQGLPAIKVHDFHRSTTATLGIPFIRTSVDHGTAFDIAGRGRADATGLGAAVAAAQALLAGDIGRLD